MPEPLYIGIDIGGTKIAGVLATREGRVVATHHSWTGAAEGAEAVLDRIADHVRELSGDHGAIRGIGIGCPGIVDARHGIVRNAVNLGWHEVSLVTETRRRADTNLPIYLEKDANAAAVGEVHFGAAIGCRDLVLLTLGTGFGAGLIVDGLPVRGSKFAAGDLGHLSLDPRGQACVCGGVGCAETILSGAGPINLAHENGFASADPVNILNAARSGDAVAMSIIHTAGEWLGNIMAIAATMVDPECIAVGGGLGCAAADLLLPIATEQMNRRMAPVLPRPRVVKSSLESSALGAAALVIAAESVA